MTLAGERTRIAIACQGGGSHTAFTAGVLKRLLGDSAVRSRHEIVGFSGTSGGAICALLAWYGFADDDGGRPGQLLDEFWNDNSATAPHEQLLNTWTLWAGTLQNLVAMPAVSPYANPFAAAGPAELRRLLTRHVDFDALPTAAGHPLLLVGAVDVLTGEFKAFDSRRDRISVEAILASAAIPTLFRAVHLDGGVYWDGLFSQNPPVRELIDARPDEIWVIQINPTRLETEPRSAVEIADRRNELAGEFLTALAFESAWVAGDIDATVAFLSDDASIESHAPFPEHGAVHGRVMVERFLREHLVAGTTIDVTRKQVAGERVTWSARWHPRDAPAPLQGAIEARFDGDRVVSIRLVAST